MIAFVMLVLSFGRAAALLDVPLGECYDCEVTCFEDCALKYQREVIQADDDEEVRLARKARLDAAHKAKHALIQEPINATQVFSWRNANPQGNAQKQKTVDAGNEFAACLKNDKCPGHAASQSTFVAHPRHTPACEKNKIGHVGAFLTRSQKKCSVSDMPCARKCAAKVAQSSPAFIQDFPLHPVAINTFSTGKMTLDFCLKSCLAATCGCDNAPGFDTINKLANQIKTNEALRPGGAVDDTAPSWQYKKATLAECGGGMFGKKINSGLHINYGRGWLEVCTEPMLVSTLGPDADVSPALAKCKSSKKDDVKYGCIWNNEIKECVVGIQPIARCFTKYQDDGLNSKFDTSR